MSLLKQWQEAYAAFKGAFDTPVSRRKDGDEFSEDARKRLRDLDEAMVKHNWEDFGKRLLAAQHQGIRIEQENGHRWIYLDLDADWFPGGLKAHPEYVGSDLSPDKNVVILKEYGSFKAALDRIDRMLEEAGERKLVERFNDLNYFYDLENILGEGTQ